MADEKNKIYVGNLEFSTTEDELEKFFREKGAQPKGITIIKDKYTGRSKGFGFVEVESSDELEKAIKLLDGQEFKGRRLKISKAREPRQRFER